MFDQISKLENQPAVDGEGEVNLIEQMKAVEDCSDYDSFHSDEIDAGPVKAPLLQPPQKDWLGKKSLQTVREDRADSVLSGGDLDIIRVAGAGAAVAGYGIAEAVFSGNKQKGVSGIGAVGSVQVAKEEEIKSSNNSLQAQRTSSYEIKQKFLMATTPQSKARVVIELTQELNMIN